MLRVAPESLPSWQRDTLQLLLHEGQKTTGNGGQKIYCKLKEWKEQNGTKAALSLWLSVGAKDGARSTSTGAHPFTESSEATAARRGLSSQPNRYVPTCPFCSCRDLLVGSIGGAFQWQQPELVVS